MPRKITIDPNDVRYEAFRAKGPGGQHRNTTDSAIRATHLPTGIQAVAAEKSQHQNKAEAFRLLEARVVQAYQDGQAARRAEDWRSKPNAAFAAQIRTYVLDRDRRVVDHRTGHEDRNPTSVLNGRIDAFLRANLLVGVKEK